MIWLILTMSHPLEQQANFSLIKSLLLLSSQEHENESKKIIIQYLKSLILYCKYQNFQSKSTSPELHRNSNPWIVQTSVLLPRSFSPIFWKKWGSVRSSSVLYELKKVKMTVSRQLTFFLISWAKKFSFYGIRLVFLMDRSIPFRPRKQKGLTEVGFEPTPPKRLEP